MRKSSDKKRKMRDYVWRQLLRKKSAKNRSSSRNNSKNKSGFKKLLKKQKENAKLLRRKLEKRPKRKQQLNWPKRTGLRQKKQLARKLNKKRKKE